MCANVSMNITSQSHDLSRSVIRLAVWAECHTFRLPDWLIECAAWMGLTQLPRPL
jgi:hypothetical protein